MVPFTRWARAADNLFSQVTHADELAGLLLEGRHLPWIEARRAAVILSRLRALAALLVALTLSLVLIDFIVFPPQVAIHVAVGRILTGVVLVLIAFSFRRLTLLRDSYWALFCLYSIPALHCLFSYGVLRQAEIEGTASVLLQLYWILPVVAVATLGMLPLTGREVVLFATPILIAGAIAVSFDFAAFNLSAQLGIYWLLLPAALVAVLAGISHRGLMDRLLSRLLRDPRGHSVFSRAGIEQLLELRLTLAARNNAPVAVALLALDDFKSATDNEFDTGEKLLLGTAGRIANTLRRTDVAGHWAGDEFIVVFPDTTSDQAAIAIERLRRVGLGTRPDGRPLTVSIGIAENTADSAFTSVTLVATAHQRMCLAKSSSANGPVIHDRQEPGVCPRAAAHGPTASRGIQSVNCGM
jgi:diguanylate cyclase (GGDEF)-like protein